MATFSTPAYEREASKQLHVRKKYVHIQQTLSRTDTEPFSIPNAMYCPSFVQEADKILEGTWMHKIKT